MAVTIESIGVTSQQTLDGYIAGFTELALRLVNDLATSRVRGKVVALPAPSDVDLETINNVLADYDGTRRHPRWSILTLSDATMLVTAVRQLREVVDACVDGDVTRAAELLNALLTAHHATPNLHGHPGRAPVLAFHQVNAGPSEARIADMATSLAMVVGADRTSRLGRCSASGCDRVFYDSTRNGSRRFCGLVCQNRAKASAYRARRAN
jgi:predicted RNA-binding Zn ribbon-like protein